MTGLNEEPQNLVERAADAAFVAIEQVLREAGARVDIAFVSLHALDVPEGEQDATTASVQPDDDAGDLDERGREMLEFLVMQAAGAAQALGLQVKVVPMLKYGRG